VPIPRAALFAILVFATVPSTARTEDPAPRTDVKTRISQAWDYYRMGEFNKAALIFEGSAAQASAGSDLNLLARYGLGITFSLRSPDPDNARAEKLFEGIVAEKPDHDLAAWSLLALARMKHAVPVGVEPDYNAVRAAYQRVIDRFPYHPAGEQAFIYQQSTLVAGLDPADAQKALDALTKFIVAHPASRLVSSAWTLISECGLTLGRADDRLAAELKALDTQILDPTNPFMDRAGAYWKIAAIAEFEAGNFTVARKYYTALINEYPTDQRKYGARLALTRMDQVAKKSRGAKRQ
jgi:tetratricopeptide (TPR) repeat protein